MIHMFFFAPRQCFESVEQPEHPEQPEARATGSGLQPYIQKSSMVPPAMAMLKMLKSLEDPEECVPSFLQSEQHLADVPGTLMQRGDRTSHDS